MIPKHQIPIFFLAVFIIILNPKTVAGKCNQSCGIHRTSKPAVSYPFGFSAGCPIRLNCSNSGDPLIGEFPVRLFHSDSITVTVEAKCNRSIQTLHSLFSNNFAPTSRNAILLQNCSSPVLPCRLPETTVETHFESPDCGSNITSNISCYSVNKTVSNFIEFGKVMESSCRNLLSAISSESLSKSGLLPASLEVQVLQLEWWVEGDCSGCSENANCTDISSPVNGKRGFRCKCEEGLVGDGFRAGSGCRKGCNPAKYISGKCGGTTKIAALAGGVAAGAFIMTSVALIYCFFRRRFKSKGRSLTKRRLSDATGLSATIPIYSYKEIEKATNNFSDKLQLGTGAYGTVYAGKLPGNADWVAIKRIKHRDSDIIEQVLNEIKLLSSVSHPNLVRLLGCSIEHGEQILVFEFMPNGTLCQHLQRERGHGLSWSSRIAIAVETAQAIAHLHSAISPPIYHRDIKSSNILLDYKFRSKVADFGLSRLGRTEISHISTAPQGTPGYLDPQYHQNFHLSDKSDVYSFGVVLVEIISGLKVVDFTRPQNEVNLANFATERIGNGCLEEIIDPFLEKNLDAWTLSSVRKVAELAFRCLAFHRDMRPLMTEVAAELEQIRASGWEFSEEIVDSCSTSCDLGEKPLRVGVERRGESSRNSMEWTKEFSPVSVQDLWLSEQSSPSSNSLLSNAIQ